MALKTPPTFEEIVGTIHTWISSCETEHQLDLIRDVVDDFIVKRFKHHISMADLADTQNGLDNAIETKRIQIIIKWRKDNNVE